MGGGVTQAVFGIVMIAAGLLAVVTGALFAVAMIDRIPRRYSVALLDHRGVIVDHYYRCRTHLAAQIATRRIPDEWTAHKQPGDHVAILKNGRPIS